MAVVKVKIEGMTCGGCVKGIKAAFENEKSVKTVNIDLESKVGEFDGDLSADAIVALIEDQGFDAEPIS